LPPGDRHDSAVRWRQLVDLVARAGPNAASPGVGESLAAIKSGAADVDESLRAAAARAVAALPLPMGMLEYFAAEKLMVSAPVLAAATLEPEQWRGLAQLADEESRRFIQTLHPEIGEQVTDFTDTLVEQPVEAAPEPEPEAEAPAMPAAGSSLSEVVARIERRRRSRAAARGDEQRGPAPEVAALFRWESAPSGELVWVDGAPRGPLIGRSIAKRSASESEGVDTEAARAFAMRAPFRDSELRIGGEGPVAGEWKISGVPAFEPADGRFAGYRGIAIRGSSPQAQPNAPSEFLADPDSLRELVHEIKTPLNAIIGFAEIIDGQLLGPADRAYRERAVEIVAQAQLLLAATDDLDFAGKVHSAKLGGTARVDLAELVDHAAEAFRALASNGGATLEIARSDRACVAAVEPELADRLIARLLSALVPLCEEGEALRLSLDRSPGQCRVALGRPAALRGLDDSALFGSARANEGAIFSLRLIRGLARIAGGDLVASPAGLALAFPNG
jgi:hypothetical protein